MISVNAQARQVKDFLLAWQNSVCEQLLAFDSEHVFQCDVWQKADGSGGGDTRILNGDVFEQAGVNFSHVFGTSLPAAATLKRPELLQASYSAMGVSVVVHPRNPYVPTTHANLRFFQAENNNKQLIWWFGGGFDLTPYYGFEEDCRYWHQQAAVACNIAGRDFYPQFKAAADAYFYLPHRKEQRGIGGIFFDDINQPDFMQCFNFIQDVAKHFLTAYLPIVKQRYQLAYNAAEREFQLYRRGRYVEFNLLYDRGTLFGLQSGGRTESILMSLPNIVHWKYNLQTAVGSKEYKLLEYYLKPRDWLSSS